MQTAEDDDRAACAKPISELIGPLGEREMNSNANDTRQRINRHSALKQILIPIPHVPTRGRRRGDAGGGESWREGMLAEAGGRIFRIERIDQKNRARRERAMTLRQ